MLPQNWACAMVVSLGVRIDFPPNFMMGLLLLFPKKEEEFQLNLAGRWDSGRTHPSPPHRNWHKLGTSLLFKTEGVVGGREVVLLGSSMQAFGLVSVSLQSPSFLLLTDPKWFRITGHSRTFFFFFPKQSITRNANTQNYLIHLWWQRIQLFALALSPQRAGLAGGQGQLWRLNFNQQFQWQYWIKKLLATS